MNTRFARCIFGLSLLFVLAGFCAPVEAQVVVQVGHPHHHHHHHHRHHDDHPR